jgi:hypothetical protein
MKKEPDQFFRELKQDILTYAELKAELLKLGMYERIGKVISILSYSFILLFFIFFLILFIFIAVGFFVSDWFHSKGIGFSVVSAIYLLLTAGIILCKDRIRMLIMNIVINALTVNNNNNNHDATGSESETNAADEPVSA